MKRQAAGGFLTELTKQNLTERVRKRDAVDDPQVTLHALHGDHSVVRHAPDLQKGN